MNNIIEVKNLCRFYEIAEKGKGSYLLKRTHKTIKAVENISFSIKAGERVGFIGPNGAGKSTTIKMMTGILLPSDGEISVLGNDPYACRKQNASRIGVVFGQRSQLWWDLPVIDTFALFKKIYKIPENVYQSNIEKYTEILGMKEFINQPVRQLSLGQRMRAELCAALLHNPEIIFLDEPTIGLDIVVKKQIREMIKLINQTNNTTVILTTHDLKDIEEVCDRIILINSGKIIVDDSIENMKDKFGGIHNVEFLTAEHYRNDIYIPEVIRWEQSENSFKAYFKTNTIGAASIIEKVLSIYKVEDIKINNPSIEDIVAEIYVENTSI